MLMAAMGSIHGHLSALEAVLRAIDDAGIQTIVNTGDCAVGHPWPNEVIDILRARGMLSVQGERDRNVARFVRKEKSLRVACTPEEYEALRETYAMLRSDNVEFLVGLPRRRTIVVDGISICLCHGSPHSQIDALRADDDTVRLRRVRESVNTDLLVCGREPEPFARWVDNALFVNPGAMHAPSDANRCARYAVIDTEREPWQAHFHSAAF